MIVGAMIRLQLKKELCFGFFNTLMETAHYQRVYLEDFAYQRVLNFQVLLHLKKELPEVYQRLCALNINIDYVTLRWFCAFFSADILNWPLLLQIWAIFAVQSWKVLIKTSLTLFRLYQQEILEIQDEDLMNEFLKNFVSDNFSKSLLKQSRFFEVYNSFKITNSQLAQIEKIYESASDSVDKLIWITVENLSSHKKIVWAEKTADLPEIMQRHRNSRDEHRIFQHSRLIYSREDAQSLDHLLWAGESHRSILGIPPDFPSELSSLRPHQQERTSTFRGPESHGHEYLGKTRKFHQLEKLEKLELSSNNGNIQLSFSFDRETSNKENIQAPTNANTTLLE